MLRLKILLAFIVVVVVSLLIAWIVFKYKRGTDNQLNRIMHITTMNSSEMITEDISEMEDLKPSEMVTSTPNENNVDEINTQVDEISTQVAEITTKIANVKESILVVEKLMMPALKRQNGTTEHAKMSRRKMTTDANGSVSLQDNEPTTD